MIHLYILLCCIADLVRQWYAIPSRLSYNSWISNDFLFYHLQSLKSFPIASIPWWTQSPFPGNQTNRPQIAYTIPQRSHYTCKFPKMIFDSFYGDTQKSSHKYLHNWIHKHEEDKYNPWIFASQKRKRIPLKMLVTPFPFTSQNGRYQGKSHNSNQR